MTLYHQSLSFEMSRERAKYILGSADWVGSQLILTADPSVGRIEEIRWINISFLAARVSEVYSRSLCCLSTKADFIERASLSKFPKNRFCLFIFIQSESENKKCDQNSCYMIWKNAAIIFKTL